MVAELEKKEKDYKTSAAEVRQYVSPKSLPPVSGERFKSACVCV